MTVISEDTRRIRKFNWNTGFSLVVGDFPVNRIESGKQKWLSDRAR